MTLIDNEHICSDEITNGAFVVGVGYQYQMCAHIYWEMQSATMSGYDITSSEIGGWNLHIHHTYNFQEGQLLENYF